MRYKKYIICSRYFFLSLEFDQIIRPQKFADARLYNIHFSLYHIIGEMYTAVLPILYGETRSGVTLHRIDRGLIRGYYSARG